LTIKNHLSRGIFNKLKKKEKLIFFSEKSRERAENQLYKLLAELIHTERKYVQDLEEVRVLGDGIFTCKKRLGGNRGQTMHVKQIKVS
jgi:hypothetical protein